LNILFICYGDFRANSITHIAGFCAGLSRLGHVCAVAVPRRLHTLTAVPDPAFHAVRYSDLLRQPACFPGMQPPDIIHAWTPRHLVATCTLELQKKLPRPARLVIHLEDNEEHLASCICSLPFASISAGDPSRWQPLFTRELIHPRRYRLFLHAADAVTHITPSLAEFIPAGSSRHLLFPGIDPAFFHDAPTDPALRRKIKLPSDARVIVYPGSVNPVNAAELRDLYQAVVLLNQGSTRPVRLVRTGASSKWFKKSLSAAQRAICIDLGFVDRRRLPAILALADVLVQPGKTGPFNDYRLPSKLAEFLASGRPVVLPATNLAHLLVDGRDALFLSDGSPADIAARCRTIFDDPSFATHLGQHGREAARRLFNLETQTTLLASLYADVVSRPSRVTWSALAASPHADETTLFPHTPDDADLASALDWARHSPRPVPAGWRRHMPSWLFRSSPAW
jgi:glycosyltransferase involved in cell wall biosynthesis